MIDGIHAAFSAPNAFPNAANSKTDDSKMSRTILEEGQNDEQEVENPGRPIPHEESSSIQAEGRSNVDSAGEVDHNEKAANVQTKETVNMTSAQRDNEANAESPAVQNELQGTILDILG